MLLLNKRHDAHKLTDRDNIVVIYIFMIQTKKKGVTTSN